MEERRLKYNVVGYDTLSECYNVIITEQTHRGKSFTPFGDRFTSKEGITLSSVGNPECDEYANTFYLQGTYREHDYDVIHIPRDLFPLFTLAVVEYNRRFSEEEVKDEDVFGRAKEIYVDNMKEWFKYKVKALEDSIDEISRAETVEQLRRAKLGVVLELLNFPSSFEHCPDCVVQSIRSGRKLGDAFNCDDCALRLKHGLCMDINSTFHLFVISIKQAKMWVRKLYGE